MKISTNKLLLASLLTTNLALGNDLGTISVESSTIDDKFDAKSLEVSNTATLSGTDVEEVHAENLAQVLNKIPGVTVRQNEGDSNKIHIRGIASEMYMGEKPGVAIVIDGVPVQERAGSVNIDSDNIESIKVIKGGASYLYGNDALGGAIIITTKRARAKSGGKASVEMGSYGYKKYLANYNYAGEEFAVRVQGSKKESDGYWEDSDYWAKSFNGKFQYYLDDTSDVTLGIDKSSRFENDTGSLTYTVGGENQVKTNPESKGEVGYGTNYDIELDKYFLTYSKDFENDSNLMAQIYKYEDTTINKSGAFDSDRDGGRDDHRYDAYANTIQQGLKSEYRQDDDTLAYMLGLDVARNDEDKNTKYRIDYTSRGSTTPAGTVTADTESKEAINAVYGEAKYQLSKKLTTTVNLRVDQIKYDFTNNMFDHDPSRAKDIRPKSYEKTFNENSYKVGATYKFNPNSVLYTSQSIGYRVPHISQLYAGDFNGWGDTNVNNLDIKTEITTNLELGYRGKTTKHSYDIAIYKMNRDDVIGKDSGNYSSTGLDTKYDNMADIENIGLELSLQSDNKQPFYYGFNYTYLDSKYTRYDEFNLVVNEAGVDKDANGDTDDDYVLSTHDLSGNTVPRTSKHTVSVDANFKATSKLLVTAEVNYRSAQYADELNSIKVDGYSVVNLRTKYATKVSGLAVVLFAKVDNILDKQYYMMPRATSDRNDDGVYNRGDMGLTVNPGRTFLAGATVKF